MIFYHHHAEAGKDIREDFWDYFKIMLQRFKINSNCFFLFFLDKIFNLLFLKINYLSNVI